MSQVDSQDRTADADFETGAPEAPVADGPLRRLGPGPRTVIVAGIAVAVGLAVWVATGSVRDGSDQAVAGSGHGPRIVTEGELTEVPDQIGHAVFWAGPKDGSRLEVSSDTSGNVHLRYLPDGVEAGDPDQSYLDIGTYPFTGAYNATRSLSDGTGLQTIRVSGGVGFMDRERPYSVIVAWPSQPDLQVEVYHPEKYRALEVVRSGDIVPVP